MISASIRFHWQLQSEIASRQLRAHIGSTLTVIKWIERQSQRSYVRLQECETSLTRKGCIGCWCSRTLDQGLSIPRRLPSLGSAVHLSSMASQMPPSKTAKASGSGSAETRHLATELLEFINEAWTPFHAVGGCNALVFRAGCGHHVCQHTSPTRPTCWLICWSSGSAI